MGKKKHHTATYAMGILLVFQLCFCFLPCLVLVHAIRRARHGEDFLGAFLSPGVVPHPHVHDPLTHGHGVHPQTGRARRNPTFGHLRRSKTYVC